MKIKSILLIILSLAGFSAGKAQFRLSAEFRPRSEYSHGYQTLAFQDQKPSFFTSQRTRLNFEFTMEGIQTRLVLQDVRLWGSQAQLVQNEDYAASIHQAWAEAKLGGGLSLRLGRQELDYDNSRLLGAVGWLQQGRSHDLALLKFNGFVQAHFGVAYHESGNRKNNFYDGPDAYKFLQFIWINKEFKDLKISLLGINNGVPVNIKDNQGKTISQDIQFTQTFGPWFEYKFRSLSVTGNAFYQMGRLAGGDQVSAYEYLAEVDWSFLKNFTIGAGYEELSGTEYRDEPDYSHTFNTLYPSGHKFAGHMDYFYAGSPHGPAGLRDFYVKAALNRNPFSLALDIHRFWAQADLPGDLEQALGTEFDFQAGYKLNDAVAVNLGYSHLLPTNSLAMIKTGSTEAVQNWGWVMFTFKPVFVK